MATVKTICAGCGEKQAGAGMRFCRRCIAAILSGPLTPHTTPPASGVVYPIGGSKRR